MRVSPWVAFTIALALPGIAEAAPTPAPVDGSQLVRTAVLLSLLALAPAMFISMTSFIRIAIVLSMIRHAFGMPETPPNAVLVSLSILLTAFVMAPTFDTINRDALQPLMRSEMTAEAAVEKGAAPLKDFMLRQVRDEDIASIYAISRTPLPTTREEVDIIKLTPAYILHELRAAFSIGFVILLPFLLIDIVVASVLLSLGMMMVPPATISLPIKLLMFVLIDGWSLILHGVVGGFR